MDLPNITLNASEIIKSGSREAVISVKEVCAGLVGVNLMLALIAIMGLTFFTILFYNNLKNISFRYLYGRRSISLIGIILFIISILSTYTLFLAYNSF